MMVMMMMTVMMMMMMMMMKTLVGTGNAAGTYLSSFHHFTSSRLGD